MSKTPSLKIRESDLKGDCYRLNRRFDLLEEQVTQTTNNTTVVSAAGGGSGFPPTPLPPGGLPLTTKGDVLTYDTAPARLPIGADGDVLTADSTQPTGNKWSPPGGIAGTISTITLTLDGGGTTPSTGIKGMIQVPWAGTISGWALTNTDVAGSISVDVCLHAGSAPPAAPAVPNTTTDKISASAPISMSAASSAAGGAAAISTWTVAVSQWSTVLFNVTSIATLGRVTIQLYITRT